MNAAPPTGARRIGQAWRALHSEERLAALAALGLLVSMLLPWYHRSFFNSRTARHGSDNLSALQAFSFVEGAILLIAIGVLLMLFARAERRAFHLPGGDGTILMAAGLWTAFLLIWRLFDQPSPSVPHGTAVDVGIHWGIFFAFVATGVLIYAGHRVRVAQRPEPPLHPRQPEPRPGEPVEVHIPDERPHLDETKAIPSREPAAEEAPTQPARPKLEPEPEGSDQPHLPGLG